MPVHGALRQVQNVSACASQDAKVLPSAKTTMGVGLEAISNIESIEKVSDESKRESRKPVKLSLRSSLDQGEEKKSREDEKCDVGEPESKVEDAVIVVPGSSRTAEAEAQTVVTISEKTPKLTAEDLKSPEVSEAYWRRVAERIHADIDRELVKNFTLSARYAELSEEIYDLEQENELLKEHIRAKTDCADSSFELTEEECDDHGSEPDEYVIPS